MKIAETAGMGLAVALQCTTGLHASGSGAWSSIRPAEHRGNAWQQGVALERPDGLPIEIIEPPGHPGVPPLEARKRGGAPTIETMASAVAALQAQVEELRRARQQDQEQIRELRERVRALEMEMADLLAEDDRGETVTDPHFDWIEGHREELCRYADMWVAIDPQRGIVAQARDGDELAERLAVLPPEERRKLLSIDVRLYV